MAGAQHTQTLCPLSIELWCGSDYPEWINCMKQEQEAVMLAPYGALERMENKL
eukprot:COSAG02_NODE_3039_length_7496_cov_89.964715_2_plen_53_part_00